MVNGQIRVEYVPLSDIRKWKRNPKQHADEQIQESFNRFGYTMPILLDERSGELVAGHGRLDNLQRRKDEGDHPPERIQTRDDGEWLVPVLRGVSFANGMEAAAYAIADNRLTELGGWDNAELARLLSMIEDETPAGLVGVGFTENEIEELLSIEDESGAGEDRNGLLEDENTQIPEVQEVAVTKFGDVWICGDHRVMCGDSTNSAHVEALCDGRRMNLLLTDPPYGVSYAEKNEFLNARGKGNGCQAPIENDSMTPDKTKALWDAMFASAFDVMADDASYYVTGPQGGDFLLLLLQLSLRDSGLILKHMLIWAKNNHVLGRCDYHYKHEPILYGWKKTHRWYGDHSQTSLIEVPKPQRSDLHPTMKPVELFARLASNSTKLGDAVLDICLGSGTTLIACEQLGRRCYGMELSPHYVDVAMRRWQHATGKHAVLESDGTPFGE